MRVVVVAVVAFLLAGCTVSRTGTPVAATHPATTTTSSTPPPPTAQDGDDYQSCADGNCEVEVSGPVTIPVPGGSLVVSDVLDDGIAFDLTATAGGGNGTLRGNCTAFFSGGGGGMKCATRGPQDPPTAMAGAIQLQIAGVADGVVVLRIVS